MKTPLQELQDWVNTELRLDGYEHKVISDKIETMLHSEEVMIKYSYWEGVRKREPNDFEVNDWYNKTFNTKKNENANTRVDRNI